MARKIYWGSGSAPCWKVLLVLEEKKLEYESKLLSFSNKEHKGPDVMALNPRGQVPVLQDGDIVVCESGASCQYLEDAYPDSGMKLLPVDPKLKALVLQRLWETNNLAAKAGEMAQHYWRVKDDPDEVAGEAMQKKIEGVKTELGYWEKYLQASASGFLVGDSLTLADCSFFPTVAFLVRMGMDSFPSLEKYYALLESRESVQKTWPPHWKESPGADLLKGI
eukprot:TRINITY_DN18062_c0_g1_i1.p1 TRINITY_DN18062_c0_g1~~TRINITY_DN18062_c0_g1_i1.p1  ORF type:complete len:222 (+),score=59.09 TRINITY_DN18062_c0_g1_i1:242-907(+)